ncbi:MAG: prepilin peptidase, partial [Acidimicrobiia bacterium]
YPAVELLTALLFVAVGARFADSWVLPAYLVFTAGLIALSLIDLEHYLLPNRVLYPVGFVSVPLLFFGSLLDDDLGAFGRALLGGVVAFAVFYVIHVISPRGMGFGDVRLSFLLGTFLGYLGWWHVVAGLFFGFLYGAIVGVTLMALGRRKRRQHIPFGPFLAAGTMTIVLVGTPIIDWYRGA